LALRRHQCAPFRRELDRIRQQVQHDLTDLPLVRLNLAKVGVHSRVQSDVTASGPLTDESQRILDGRGEVEVRELQIHPPGLDLRHSCVRAYGSLTSRAFSIAMAAAKV